MDVETRQCRTVAKRTTAGRCLEARAAVNRYGLCRVPAPHLTRSENGKGRGGGARGVRRATATEAPSSHAFFQLFDDEDAELGDAANQPGRGGPQYRVQLRTVERIADVVPMVQILDIPVPQKVERLADFLVLLDTQTPVDQVIAVPKISNGSIQPRTVICVVRRWQNSWWKYRRCCPMPYSSSRLPSRSLTFRFLVVVLVREVFMIFFQNRVNSASWS